MYPSPTIFSKHTFVGLNPDGIRLGDFITNDPEMRSLATQFQATRARRAAPAGAHP
jgi:hypothetical protein